MHRLLIRPFSSEFTELKIVQNFHLLLLLCFSSEEEDDTRRCKEAAECKMKLKKKFGAPQPSGNERKRSRPPNNSRKENESGETSQSNDEDWLQLRQQKTQPKVINILLSFFGGFDC